MEGVIGVLVWVAIGAVFIGPRRRRHEPRALELADRLLLAAPCLGDRCSVPGCAHATHHDATHCVTCREVPAMPVARPGASRRG